MIDKENQYTRDLFPAYKIFSKHYPEKAALMKQALKYAIDPARNADDVIAFLDDFGNWMILESEKWLKVHNPNKVKNLQL